MRRLLQSIIHNRKLYDRPQDEWVCGRAEEGCPCVFGPDAKGQCRATSQCLPAKKGDRWFCTRAISLGAACVFRLRRTMPNAARPYRALGYPWLPGFFVAAGLVSLLHGHRFYRVITIVMALLIGGEQRQGNQRTRCHSPSPPNTSSRCPSSCASSPHIRVKLAANRSSAFSP